MIFENFVALAEKHIETSQGSQRDFQATHLALLKKKAFHSPLLDGYKFTNIERFLDGFTPSEAHTPSVKTKSELPSLRFIDGVLEVPQLKIPGLTITLLKDHFQEVGNLFQEKNALSHLHHSLLGDGIILELEKGTELTTPLLIEHILTKDTLSAPTVIIVAKPFSKVTIMEEVVNTHATYATVNETYLVAQPGAKIEHIQLDEGTSESLDHSSVYAQVDRDATVRSFFFNIAGKLNRKNLILDLNQAGAHGESYSLYLTSGTEHSDVNTVINHHAADTTSNQIAKGILDQESKGIFTGRIHIHPKAQRVVSGQVNKNLLLSKKAQVHSQPQLEIFADDVKCSHGSTTGQLSDDEIFYFQARGIPAEKARTLLAHGFGLEVVQKIENSDARKILSHFVMKSLETKFHLRGIE